MASTASTSAVPTRVPEVRATSASAGVISQSRLGSTSAAGATCEPPEAYGFCPSPFSRRVTSECHSSPACSMHSASPAAKCRPTDEVSWRALPMPISSTVTGRPSLRPSASAMTSGARPRGCWPRIQRATDVLS